MHPFILGFEAWLYSTGPICVLRIEEKRVACPLTKVMARVIFLFACGRVQMKMVRHACAARDEAQQLADEFCALISLTTVATPAIHQLYAYLDPATPPLPEGSAEILLAEPAHMESLRLM